MSLSLQSDDSFSTPPITHFTPSPKPQFSSARRRLQYGQFDSSSRQRLPDSKSLSKTPSSVKRAQKDRSDQTFLTPAQQSPLKRFAEQLRPQLKPAAREAFSSIGQRITRASREQSGVDLHERVDDPDKFAKALRKTQRAKK